VARQKRGKDVVIIAPRWATQGRMALGALLPQKDFGRFDVTAYERILEVSVNGARAPETEALVTEQEREFGRLALRIYRRPEWDEVVYNFLDHGQGATNLGFATVKPQLMIDHWFNSRLAYFAQLGCPVRRSTSPTSASRCKASLTFDGVPFSGRILRGHGIVGYRTGRFNRGGPVTLSVFADGALLGTARFRNFGPLEPFAFQLPPHPSGTIRFELAVNAQDPERQLGFAADVRSKPQVRR
jgi:hypothetical protein